MNVDIVKRIARIGFWILLIQLAALALSFVYEPIAGIAAPIMCNLDASLNCGIGSLFEVLIIILALLYLLIGVIEKTGSAIQKTK